MDKKLKFYESNWFIWLTLVFFAPVGIFLIWKQNKFKKGSRIAISTFFGLIFIIAVASSGTNGTSNNQIYVNKDKEEKSSSVFAVNSEEKTEKKISEESKKEEKTQGDNSVSGELKIHFIDVGQADSILIQQGNYSMLIDAGNNADSETVKNYISDQGITNLDYVIGTHPHEDHIGGLDYVINSFKIGKIYMPQKTATTKTFEDVVNAAKNKGLKFTIPKVGETFKLGKANCIMLGPSKEYENTNDNSIVIKVVFGNNSFLFEGDAEATAEMDMVKAGLDLSTNVIKIGHHGSNTSTCINFLEKVNPQYAIISVGKGNDYGHPSTNTMDRLKNKGIKVYRTDENGNIIATSNGKDISFNVKPGSYAGKESNKSSNNTSKSTKSNTTKSNTASSIPKSTSKNSSSNNNTKSSSTNKKEVTTCEPAKGDRIVYWVQNGKSYHYNKNCRSLAKSKTIIEGPASKCPKTDPCNNCVR